MDEHGINPSIVADVVFLSAAASEDVLDTVDTR